MVHTGVERLGQPGQVDRRLVPVAVLPALETVKDIGVFQHRRGVAEGKRLNAGGAGRRRCVGRRWRVLGLAAARAQVSCFTQE